MKVKLFMLFVLFGLFFVVNVSAQKVNIDKLPEYVVVKVKDKSFVTNFDVDIKIIKKSKYANELKKLEMYLDDNEVVQTYNDLLNEMHEIGYNFVESFVRNESGSRHNLIFRKKS